MLSVYFFLSFMSVWGVGSLDYLILFLVMFVCEGCFGIGILIYVARWEGGDFFGCLTCLLSLYKNFKLWF